MVLGSVYAITHVVSQTKHSTEKIIREIAAGKNKEHISPFNTFFFSTAVVNLLSVLMVLMVQVQVF